MQDEKLDNQYLPTPVQDFIQKLHQANIPFLVVGAFAMGAHGFARQTVDVDLWLEMKEQYSAQLVQIFVDQGSTTAIATEVVAYLASNKFIRSRIGSDNANFGLDLIVNLKGMSFEEAYTRKLTLLQNEVPIHYLSLDDLYASKLAAKRSKDSHDIQNLRIAIAARRTQGQQGS